MAARHRGPGAPAGGRGARRRPRKHSQRVPHDHYARMVRTPPLRTRHGARDTGHVHYTRHLRRRAPWCAPVARSRCVWARCPHRAAAPHRPRWLTAAVRGLAVCDIRHYARKIRTATGRCALPRRRDEDIAPYRHYTRLGPTRITRRHYTRATGHAHYPGGAMVGRHRPWGLPTASRLAKKNDCAHVTGQREGQIRR